jgi:acetylxylan esterase
MKKSRPILAAGFLAAMAVFGPGVSADEGSGCIAGLRMIAARGTLEPAGMGVIGTVANGVAAAVPNSTVLGLDYPATFRDYMQSEANGVAALTTAVSQYIGNCTNSKIALLGYSQVLVFPVVTGFEFSSPWIVPADAVDSSRERR